MLPIFANHDREQFESCLLRQRAADAFSGTLHPLRPLARSRGMSDKRRAATADK
jgi:hypothetical protein